MPDRHQPPRIVDRPEPCFVRMRVKRGGPWMAARIWSAFGMLMAEINGEPAAPERVWHSGDRIDEREYDMLLARMNDQKPF